MIDTFASKRLAELTPTAFKLRLGFGLQVVFGQTFFQGAQVIQLALIFLIQLQLPGGVCSATLKCHRPPRSRHPQCLLKDLGVAELLADG